MKICFTCHNKFTSESDWECPSCHARPETVDGYVACAPELAKENTGFKPESFAHLYAMESGNFWFRSRNRIIQWALAKYFPEAKTFLEIGCGTGFVLSTIERSFPHLRLYGSDIYTCGLAFASSRTKNAQLFQMDARKIPFDDEFDVIGCFDVLEHVREDGQVLSQLYQAVRPGGGIILTVPQHRFLWSFRDEYALHVRRYSARDLSSKLKRSGFKVIKVVSFVSLLFPLMLASRLHMKKKGTQADPRAELKISGTLNNLFEKVLTVEQGLIRMGISFPFGGSLLVIAKKQETTRHKGL